MHCLGSLYRFSLSTGNALDWSRQEVHLEREARPVLSKRMKEDEWRIWVVQQPLLVWEHGLERAWVAVLALVLHAVDGHAFAMPGKLQAVFDRPCSKVRLGRRSAGVVVVGCASGPAFFRRRKVSGESPAFSRGA